MEGRDNPHQVRLPWSWPPGKPYRTSRWEMTSALPQKQDLRDIVLQHQDVFSEVPRRTTVAQHDIRTAAGVTVHVPPYRVPEARRVTIRAEVDKMLLLRVIKESHSTWASSVVLVPKPDGSFRFCNDFRRLNEVSEFDAYPMPRVD